MDRFDGPSVLTLATGDGIGSSSLARALIGFMNQPRASSMWPEHPEMPAWRAPNLEGAFQAVRRNEALNAANAPYMVVGAQAVNAWIATIDEGATHAAPARNVHQSAQRSSYRTTPSSPARPSLGRPLNPTLRPTPAARARPRTRLPSRRCPVRAATSPRAATAHPPSPRAATHPSPWREERSRTARNLPPPRPRPPPATRRPAPISPSEEPVPALLTAATTASARTASSVARPPRSIASAGSPSDRPLRSSAHSRNP